MKDKSQLKKVLCNNKAYTFCPNGTKIDKGDKN